jgi:hypothetical protein
VSTGDFALVLAALLGEDAPGRESRSNSPHLLEWPLGPKGPTPCDILKILQFS